MEETRVHSLFGSPVEHSLSPVIFNSTFQKLSLNRSLDKAKRVAEDLHGRGRVSYGKLTKKNLETSIPGTNLLVNATPLQTTKILSKLAIQPQSLRDIDWVFDLAYDEFSDPLPSRSGRISPLEMLVHQAALSFEIWLGKPAPFALMRSSLTDHLGQDWK